MAENSWAKYLREVSNGAPGREIARRVGVSDATVSHWRSGNRAPKPRDAVAVAKAFGRPVSEALIATGVVTAEDFPANGTIEVTGLSRFKSSEIAFELARRYEEREQETGR